MAIQWNKSLYSKLNAESSAENKRLCQIVQSQYPEVFEGYWGCVDTLHKRKLLVDGLQSGNITPEGLE